MKWIITLSSIAIILYGSFAQREKYYVIREHTIDTVQVFRSVYDYQPFSKYHIPNQEILDNMDKVAQNILIPLENWVYRKTCKKIKIPVNSFWRPWSKNSDHRKGLAVDVNFATIEGISNLDASIFIRDSLRCIKQLIVYNDREAPSFLHISYGFEFEYLFYKWGVYHDL